MAGHPEFFDYAERIKDDRMLNDHEEWLHTSLLGRLTHTVLTYAKQSDLFNAVADSLEDQESGVSPNSRLLTVFMTMSIVAFGVIGVYAIGRLIQMIIGKEIVVEQKVIIETQVKWSDLMMEEEAVSNGQNKATEDIIRRKKTSKNTKEE